MLKGKLIVLAVIVAAVAALSFLGSTDSGYAGDDHDLAIRKTTGDVIVGGASECQPVVGCGYNTQIVNNGSQTEQGQLGIEVDFVGGCAGATVSLSGGSASAVVASGEFTDSMVVDVTIPANKKATVNVNIVYPSCAAPGTIDYVISADLCHEGDAAPAGLFGSGSCGDAYGDGVDSGADPDLTNDATVTRNIDRQ